MYLKERSQLQFFVSLLKPYMPSELFYLKSLDMPISNRKGVWLVFIITMLYKKYVFNTNSAYPDQTQRSVAFDLGLHCLSMSLLWDTRHTKG